MNGKVDLGNGSGQCGACHGTGDSPWPSTAAHPAHENPTLTVSLACSNCHVVPAAILDPGHLDGTVHVTFSGLATARGAQPDLERQPVHERRLPWSQPRRPCRGAGVDGPSGAQAKCGACHGIPPSQHTPSTSCDRSDCHGSEVMLDGNGDPLISASGKTLHVDGIIESAR